MNDDTSFWIPDDFARKCQKCSEIFGNLVRKHHCRCCGGVYCDNCASFKINHEDAGLRDARGCVDCNNFVNNILPFLLTEQRLTLYCHVDKSTEEAKVRIAETLTNLEISTPSHRSSARTPLLKGGSSSFRPISLDTYENILDGQVSPTFAKFKESNILCCSFSPDIASFAPTCFSIVFSGETLDLQASTVSAKQRWVSALKDYITQTSTPAGQKFISYVGASIGFKQDSEVRVGKAVHAQRMNNYHQKTTAIAEKWSK